MHVCVCEIFGCASICRTVIARCAHSSVEQYRRQVLEYMTHMYAIVYSIITEH